MKIVRKFLTQERPRVDFRHLDFLLVNIFRGDRGGNQTDLNLNY
jgi:hypothetical protein